jgi:predicted nucleic acid-binding protein
LKGIRLYDASSIFEIMREHRGGAPDLLSGGSTIPLVYYEIGNAIWKLCTKPKRMEPDEAKRLLATMFSIVLRMNMVRQEDAVVGVEILETAIKRSLTYYDAAYLVEAKRSGRALVTDDDELARAADLLGVENMRSAEVA